jgi:hypothetical protein
MPRVSRISSQQVERDYPEAPESPVLSDPAYYRSQHPNQSWLAALTTVVDVSALAILSAEDDLKRQAQFTFAARRHALVHTASLFRARPRPLPTDRLPPEDLSSLCATPFPISNARRNIEPD